MLITSSATLTDEALVGRILSTAASERTATATLIADLAELESRRLHLAQGFKSLFGYCRHVLHCSEHESYNRMHAVHAARRFPVILQMLAEGLLHMTAVRLLAPHLRDEDHLVLLGGAIHKSKREVMKHLAGWFPSADVQSTIRKLPTAVPADNGNVIGPGPDSQVPAAAATGSPTAEPSLARPAGPAIVAPLSADRYRVQITVSNAAHDDLRFLQDAMRREIPNGDPAEIVARALAALASWSRRSCSRRRVGPGQWRRPTMRPVTSPRMSSARSGSATRASARSRGRTTAARSARTSSITT
jgi:hypothetical protein